VFLVPDEERKRNQVQISGDDPFLMLTINARLIYRIKKGYVGIFRHNFFYQTAPETSTKPENSAPQAMRTTGGPSKLISWGVLFMAVPAPPTVWPDLLSPHAKTLPLSERKNIVQISNAQFDDNFRHSTRQWSKPNNNSSRTQFKTMTVTYNSRL